MMTSLSLSNLRIEVILPPRRNQAQVGALSKANLYEYFGPIDVWPVFDTHVYLQSSSLSKHGEKIQAFCKGNERIWGILASRSFNLGNVV
jgi:hypothetical protein